MCIRASENRSSYHRRYQEKMILSVPVPVSLPRRRHAKSGSRTAVNRRICSPFHHDWQLRPPTAATASLLGPPLHCRHFQLRAAPPECYQYDSHQTLSPSQTAKSSSADPNHLMPRRKVHHLRRVVTAGHDKVVLYQKKTKDVAGSCAARFLYCILASWIPYGSFRK